MAGSASLNVRLTAPKPRGRFRRGLAAFLPGTCKWLQMRTTSDTSRSIWIHGHESH